MTGWWLLFNRLHQSNELVVTADIVEDVASEDGWDCIPRFSLLRLHSSSFCYCCTLLIVPLKFRNTVLKLKKGL